MLTESSKPHETQGGAQSHGTLAPLDTRGRTRLECDLSPTESAFAALVAQGSPLNVAYRQAHNVGEGTKRETVNNHAHALAKRPAVAAHIAELRAAIAERVVISAAALRMRQDLIANAPALTHVVHYACRYCASDGKHYQFADADEYVDACEQAVIDKRKPPSFAGGVGFTGFDPPNPRCRRCRGVGEAFVYGPLDTRDLPADLAASFKGASVDGRSGIVSIQQHDQQAAAKELHAMVGGAYAPKQTESTSRNLHLHAVRTTPAELTAEEAIALFHAREGKAAAP